PSAAADDVRARPRRRDVLALLVRERPGRRRGGRGLRRVGRRPHLSPIARLPVPQPFSLELTTARFRAFGLDRATVWEDGALYRAVGGRELRIAAVEGGVDVEPLDAETEPVVRKLLGFEFALVAFSAWAADQESLEPLVVRFVGFRPTL